MRRTQLGVRLGLAWCASVIAASAGGCETSDGPKTQVIVTINAQEGVRAITERLVVELEGLGSSASDGTVIKKAYGADQPEPLEWPSTIVIEPRKDDISRRYHIVATVYGGDSKPIAVLRVESGFVAHKTLEAHLYFEESCLEQSLVCRTGETCVRGECFPSLVDPSMLKPFGERTPEVASPGSAGTGTKTSGVAEAGAGGVSAAGAGGISAAGAGGMSAAGAAGPPPMSSGNPSVVGNCGDGKVSGEEKCDTAIRADQPGACPTRCGAASACEPSSLEGSGCQTRCQPHRITAPEPGDGCCPEGADSSQDSDCTAVCGNGQVEAGEACDPPDSCPTGDTCKSSDACLSAYVAGDREHCNATCVTIPIEDCKSDDGCCPSGCNTGNDNDCSPACGDGIVDPRARELCEPNSGTAPCPTSCNDSDVCTVDLLTGSARNCNSVCTHVPIYTPIYNDGCCPTAVGSTIANANNDNDCQPVCGNGVVERGERCDGDSCPSLADCSDGNVCTRDEVIGTGCARACAHTAITRAANGDGCCPANANANTDDDCVPVCGNMAKESGEDCDPPQTACRPLDDGDRCTMDVQTSPCKHPMHTPIPASGTGSDGCCPPNTTFAADADCPGCGNGKKEGTEECDTLPATATCVNCKVVEPPAEDNGSMDPDPDPDPDPTPDGGVRNRGTP